MARMDPQDAVRTLVQMANLEGGNDNITVQIVQIPGEPREKDRTTEVIVAPEIREREGPPIWVWISGIVLVAALLWLLIWR
jgi:serine/threonine protein phosphatase PrpC